MTAPTLADDARELIEQHVQAVDRALAAGHQSAGERGQIIDNVRAQIWEMLRASGQDRIDAALAQGVLRRMDPPRMYGARIGTGRRAPRRHGELRIIALFLWSSALASLLAQACFAFGVAAGMAGMAALLALGYQMYRAAPGWNSRASWIAASLLILGVAFTMDRAREIQASGHGGALDAMQFAQGINDGLLPIGIGASLLLGGAVAAWIAIRTRPRPTSPA